MPRAAYRVEQNGPGLQREAQGQLGQRRRALKLTPPTLAVLLAAIIAIAVLSQNLLFSPAKFDLSTQESCSIVNSPVITTNQISPPPFTENIKMSSTEQT